MSNKLLPVLILFSFIIIILLYKQNQNLSGMIEYEKGLGIGEAAYKFTATTINGDEFSLDSKNALLIFFNATCDACQITAHQWQELYDRYHSETTSIVAISKETMDATEDFILQHYLSLPIILEAEPRELENPIIQTQIDNKGTNVQKQVMSGSIAMSSEQTGFQEKALEIEIIHELSISPKEDSPATYFHLAYPVKADFEGNIYVAESWNQKTCTIKKFDAHGNYLLSIGGKGEGPGEFLGAFDFVFEQDTILTVFDPRTARITRFRRNGVYLSSVQIQFSEMTPQFAFGGCAIGPGNTYYLSFHDRHSDRVIHKFDAQGKYMTSFGSPFQVKESHSAFVAERLKRDIAQGKLTISKGTLWFTQINPYEIRSYTSDGALQRKITRKNSFMPPAKVEIKGNNRYKFWTPSQSTGIAIWQNIIINCVYVPTHIDDRFGTVIDFFSLEGQLLNSITLKEEIKFTHIDGKGKIYGIERNEDVGEKIVRYAIKHSKFRTPDPEDFNLIPICIQGAISSLENSSPSRSILDRDA